MIRKYRLPLQTKGYVETIRVPQYDQSYMLVFEIHGLLEGTTDLEDYTAKMEGTRSDGLKYEYTGTISGTSVSFEIDTRMTAAAGNGEARIVFSYASTGEIYASANFQTYIDASPVPDDAADADTEEAREIADEIREIVSTAAAQTTAEAERIVAGLEADVADVKENLSDMNTATASDVGKYLRATAVENGKVTGWQFSTPSGGGGGGGGGQDGFSPIVAVTNITGGHRVSITDADGTKTFDVMDGAKGTDGVSPTVTVTNITGGHRVSITDATGTKTFDVMDGTGGSGGYSPWSSKKVCVFGDSIGYGYNNNAHSFVDVLSERGFFASVHKNCVSGSTTATWTARLQESSTEIADADIIYAEYEANDIVGLKAGSLTTDALVSTVRNCSSAIRNVNPTCTIIWMPLTIQHLSKIAGTDLSYYQSWVNAMYPVFAELGINLLPIFDTLNTNHASSDGRHPNDAGHEAIAELIMQNPLGYSNYPIALS